ncbi:hypothetical protein [Mycobacterium sp.]|uniref:hypothetical protein n=1 Tax=Mycobacterium sp. TaxID=1785 RepID=UPI003F96AAFC
MRALRSRRYGQNRSYLAGGVGQGAFDGRDTAPGGALMACDEKMRPTLVLPAGQWCSVYMVEALLAHDPAAIVALDRPPAG